MVDLRKMGYNCGNYPPGKNNAITDVPGVAVGHETIIKGEGKHKIGGGPIRTGVTVVLPHEGNLFMEKVLAGVFVANGYGKSTGISQIRELGCIETPIAVTNTLNVGLVFDALISYSISKNLKIGLPTTSFSPVVTECSDGFMNDIQGRHVKESHVLKAIQNARSGTKFEQGCIGAGTGMRAFGLKSGVGTASRKLNVRQTQYNKTYHLGALVVPNYGDFNDFQFYGTQMASILDKKKYFPKVNKQREEKKNGGSIIVIIATDLPLTHRQLNRLALRGALGIARTGSIMSHSSGDFIFTFSTSNKIEHSPRDPFKEILFLNEHSLILSDLFRMTIDAVQEAIYNAMLSAETMVGKDDHLLVALDPNDLP